MPDQEHQRNQISKHAKNFEILDATLTQFGMSEEQKIALYKILASILHLGKLEFAAYTEGCQLVETKRKSIENAATLLGVNLKILSESLMTRTINDKYDRSHSKITYIFIIYKIFFIHVLIKFNLRIRLECEGAKKATDTLSKLLYESLFRQILSIISERISFESSERCVGILDIAGFGN